MFRILGRKYMNELTVKLAITKKHRIKVSAEPDADVLLYWKGKCHCNFKL